MGPPEGERDWVDVASDLLSKCHISLRLRKLTDCNADVFIALYENIFGEKVPDYIAAPCSQEDDVHNIQSVIDSLSLDYLQISLSHITGENIVRGESESIKNLLEIFDGLLEYLNEEINEESQSCEELNEIVDEDESDDARGPKSLHFIDQKERKLEGTSVSSSVESAVHSSKQSLHSWNAEEVGSARELIGLGVSARTFTDKREGAVTPSGPVDIQEAPPAGPLHSAIALQPPHQCDSLHIPSPAPRSPRHLPTAAGRTQGQTQDAAIPLSNKTSKLVADTVTNGILSPALCLSPAVSEKSVSSQQRAGAEVETLEPTNGGPRRVLFRTQPDVLFLTLQDELTATTPSPPDTEDEEDEEDEEDDEEGCEDLSRAQRFKDRGITHRNKAGISNNRMSQEQFEEFLSHRRQRNKQAEEELHQISENLSHRLEELDQMLKRVLGESGESSGVREEDKQSHHSDSVMECRRTPRQHAGTADNESSQRTRSLSPSPPRVRRSLHGQLGDVTAEASSLDDDGQTKPSASGHTRREELRHKPSRIKHGKYLENRAFEEELRSYEDQQRTELHKARLKAQKAEREYRDAILGDVSDLHASSPAKTKGPHRTQPSTHTRGQRRPEPKKASPLKVKENELLPVLREELPHLHISPRALDRMWKQQMQQVDRLHALSSPHSHRKSKLSGQLEEAQRKYDLLVEITRKDQDHSKRLKDVRDRVQQQKSLQSRLKEQRQQIARAKKYHGDYHVQHRARLTRARTKEERMFRQLFEEGLELQKLRLREQKAYAKEQRLEHQRKHEDRIKSMENYYKDQFSLLAEKLAQEREEIQVRRKAQEKALLKMKRELRSQMECEISELQRIIVQNDEDDHVQDVEVQRLRSRVHMASFQYNTSCLN
ncbi:centrosomal protein of 95 kDa-like isoform X2 [Cololabis saira]|uniref:centrosomal protein of 95 kDa-like isoform X2 n=1 Tax=Cololabis saira TaxID=129043 RepID=UPI002AD57FC7|nr:centrosomal protein of 95 kDa-like isoform X2 [Cololabis saira]